MTRRGLRAQIVIASHKADRPVARAVNSVLDSNSDVGVVMVAHGLLPKQMGLTAHPRLQIITCEDGLGFPGVPFNKGIAHCTAPLIGRLDSDDWYDAGAVESMIRRIESTNSDGVIAPLRHSTAKVGLNPLTMRRQHLQAARDRLFYRTAPMGLFRREILQNPNYKYYEDVLIGEDFPVSVRLWTSGLSICHFATDPAYVVGEDAETRLTTAQRPLSETFEGLNKLIDQDWVKNLSATNRAALSTKLLRVHVLAILPSTTGLEEFELAGFAETVRRIVSLSTSALGPFSVTDTAVLRAILSAETNLAASMWAERLRTPLRHRFLAPSLAGTMNYDSNLRRTMVSWAEQTRNRLSALLSSKSKIQLAR